MRVFLVEDAPLLRERLVALIASVGASTVGHAEGAREAIEGILASALDAVVLDLHLKEGNGFDVLRAVRKAAPAIVFFVLTNHPHEGYRAGQLPRGFDKSSEFEKRDAPPRPPLRSPSRAAHRPLSVPAVGRAGAPALWPCKALWSEAPLPSASASCACWRAFPERR
jgi:CheY-like chemotaxis protein